MEKETWQSIAQRKRAERDALIPEAWRIESPCDELVNVTGVPRTCGLLSARELDITENYDATALAKAIANRELTSVDVTTAFCKVRTISRLAVSACCVSMLTGALLASSNSSAAGTLPCVVPRLFPLSTHPYHRRIASQRSCSPLRSGAPPILTTTSLAIQHR